MGLELALGLAFTLALPLLSSKAQIMPPPPCRKGRNAAAVQPRYSPVASGLNEGQSIAQPGADLKAFSLRAMLCGKGGKGAIELAKAVMESFGGEESLETAGLRPLYDLEEPVVEKIKKVARAMYGARDVAFTKAAEKDLKLIEKLGYNNLPICIAKAPSSLSDDPALRGRPRDFEVGVRNIVINSGAGFLVVLTGNIMRMPGLPRKPLAHSIDVVNGEIVGME